MTATERVRELLDERGVEYQAYELNPFEKTTAWDIDTSDLAHEVCAGFEEFDSCTTLLRFWNCTPEQAIAATLGSCSCSNDCTDSERTDAPRLPHWWTHDGALHVELPKLPDSISVRLPDQRDREVSSARVWQYTLGAGTCHNTQSDFDFMCSECGKCVDNGRVLGFNFCPRCGRRIVEVDE